MQDAKQAWTVYSRIVSERLIPLCRLEGPEIQTGKSKNFSLLRLKAGQFTCNFTQTWKIHSLYTIQRQRNCTHATGTKLWPPESQVILGFTELTDDNRHSDTSAC